MRKFFIFFIFFIFLFSCKEEKKVSLRNKEKTITEIEVRSSSFVQGSFIPMKYTCDGENVSPQISWSKVKGAVSYCLIMEDPDAPFKTWIHWIVFDIPKEVNSLPEGVDEEFLKKIEAKQGLNDFKKLNYGGPCPPSGVHRYFFKIYALSKKTELSEGITKKVLIDNIKDFIVGEGELMGRYKRQGV